MLQNLDLSENQLSGTLPDSVMSLSSLHTLYLHQNRLNGTLPTSVGVLSALRILSIFGNELSGAIPTELGSVASMEQLVAHGNQFAGTIPLAIGDQWTKMVAFFVDGNDGLTGDMPASICELQLAQLYADCQRIRCSCCTFCCVNANDTSALLVDDSCQFVGDPTTSSESPRNNSMGMLDLPI
jgi:hypothetical protein